MKTEIYLMTKKRKRHQVTCECSAYDFPHRIGGGACTGSGWCGSYKEIDSSLCEDCNCFESGECQVETGQEKFKHGDCYETEFRSSWLKDKYGNLPKSQEEIFEIELRNYYD